VEAAADKLALATATVERSGLAAHIRLVHDDAGRVLQGVDDATQDLVFLDADRAAYIGWWEHVRRILRPGGLLVVDNATSHRAELAAFVARVTADTGFAACVVPVGNGEFVAVKGARAPVHA
jgi:predicted O-methyltransferase YrrM